MKEDPLLSVEYDPRSFGDSVSSASKTPSTTEAASIVFQNVNFSYPSRPDVQVMNDFSLHIEPGEVIAIVGGSGSGKPTIANVLTRLYDIDGATNDDSYIGINGRSIREYDPNVLRKMIGIVAQDPALFRGTIRENIIYGEWSLEERQDDLILEAARQAHVMEFAQGFPDGLDTMIGPSQLSGGQRQRIALARVLAKQSPIIILDEATSALDAQSEQEALERERCQWIVVCGCGCTG